MKNLLPKRIQNSNKGTYGTVLNVAGCSNYIGAAYLSSISALKVGAGKCMLASTQKVCDTISTLSPEIILYPLKAGVRGEISEYAELPKLIDFSVVSIGCGLSQEEQVLVFFQKFLQMAKSAQIPCVIDADGLNLLAKCDERLNSSFVLTPHPKELSRLMGCDVDEVLGAPQIWALKCSEKYNCITVLKTHETVVCDTQGNIYKNATGNSALAKGGSGDVLCGMISGFIAQGVTPFSASKLAVYLHGLAGEIASKDLTEYSVLASDVINYIPQAIKTLL